MTKSNYIFLLFIFLNFNLFAFSKKALITGITGQDGYYLTAFLLNKNYKIYGISRSINYNLNYINDLENLAKINNSDLQIYYGNIEDTNFLESIIKSVEPDEIYNLSAQSNVVKSYSNPIETIHANVDPIVNILHIVLKNNLKDKIRIFQASTSELFGNTNDIPQNENTKFYPRSTYGVSKLAAYWSVVNYREAYGIFACNGILFNHESERRGIDFVTRKITRAVARIRNGSKEPLYLGNLDSKRDWGYAKDYVEAMWLMLQQEEPDDYVIATGQSHSVREFVEIAFKQVGIDIIWQDKGINEVGINKNTGEILVKVDPKFYRPTEVNYLLGDPKKALNKLSWKPKTTFNELVKLMVENDCKNLID